MFNAAKGVRPGRAGFVPCHILFAAWLTLPGCSSSPARISDSTDSRPAKLVYQFTEVELDHYLKSLAGRGLSPTERASRFARELIGQPYRLSLLGEFPFELYDADPLYCLSAGDCVTFVEHVYAMALSDDWPAYFRNLMRLRYRHGDIGMRTRNHFTEADWNVNNAWLFQDITSRLAPGSFRPMRVMVDRAAFFRKYDLGQDIPIETVETTFIPSDAVAGIDHLLQPGDVIEFVRGAPESPYVGHMGLIAERRAGRSQLIHSGSPRVQERALRDYLATSKQVLGIKVLRYHAPDGGG